MNPAHIYFIGATAIIAMILFGIAGEWAITSWRKRRRVQRALAVSCAKRRAALLYQARLSGSRVIA